MVAVRRDFTLPLGGEARRGSRFGGYDLVAPIARGGMGGVYLATDRATGESVALKVLDVRYTDHDEVVARLFGERAVSARARHPGLVAIRAAARTSDDVPFLVMEYLDGKTLAELVVDEPVELRALPAIGAQVASALAALHEIGVVHCDVKPDNVFVLGGALARPRVKVIDFGVSRSADEPPPGDASIAGTPAYMAPEQWRGAPCPASDIYSLGCLLYELATGDAPFAGSVPELMASHLERRPGRPSWLRGGLPIELERPILRALAKDPTMRPTAAELAHELGALAAD